MRGKGLRLFGLNLSKMSETRELNLNSILVCSDDILESDLGDEKVMMCIDRGRYYGLNEVAKLIHDGCDGNKTLSDIVDSLTQEFDITREECTKQVLLFAEQLIQEGLLLRDQPDSK